LKLSFISVVVGILKGFDTLLNLVLDDGQEYVRGNEDFRVDAVVVHLALMDPKRPIK
jgi:small nuclear ribonucleoprotein (snRNP)-like protein